MMSNKYVMLAVAFALYGGLSATAFAAGGGAILSDPGAMEGKHFHPKGKIPSQFTIELQKGLRATLPFEDKREFEEAKKGFIVAPPNKQIMAEASHVAWDMGSYEYLLQGKDFDSFHPSLQRQAILNMAYGLYEVVPGTICQVRGFDLANFSFIKGDTGWIVFDPLTAKETAKAALDSINDKLGKRPVVAVVYSHSHGDHYGGVRGLVDEADVKSSKVPVIAPVGFMERAVAENVYAGNAMNRRMFFQYGVLLPRSPFGHVDQSIGKNTAAGNVGLIEPTRDIAKDFEDLTADSVTLEFQNTPGTEAPAEMNTWFPQVKAFWAVENITGTIHNIYTLPGALVRDALAWSKHVNVALYRYGQEAEYLFAAHSWPCWGNARIQEVMHTQRDAYAHLNNNVLYHANKGVIINEIHNVYRQPKFLQQQWAAHSYHGSEEHNSRAMINRYLGYWDANPATLIPLSPVEPNLALLPHLAGQSTEAEDPPEARRFDGAAPGVSQDDLGRQIVDASLGRETPVMISLEIHLQAMFTNDTVIVRVNGKEVFHETSVTTDTKRMRATVFQRTIDPGEVTVSVEVPTKNVSGSQVFHVTSATFITVNLTEGQLEIREEPGGVFYA